jgi:hypothetical protein
MLESLTATTQETLQKKRGRKATATPTNYFDVREEEAVRMFLLAETQEEKNKVYNEFLRYPLDKMISSIIRRYKLYRKDMDFREIHNDYFGTICKNYLMGQIIKDQKETNRKVSYEDISSSLEERPDMIYTIDADIVETEVVIISYLDELKSYIDNENLSTSEVKLGYALIDLFENYETIFSGNDNNKFNKNIVLLSLREMTNLSTKEIRNSMKKFKKLYLMVQTKIKE